MQQIFKTAIAASFSLMLALEAQAQAQNEDTFRQLELFGDVFERVRAAYVDQVGDDVLIEKNGKNLSFVILLGREIR